MAFYFQVLDEYPLIVAANRDERYDRPSAAPGLFGSNPTVFAGKDLLAGGTWLGVNEYGLLVGILNRRSTSEQAVPTNTRSRGLFCLDLLALQSAADAREFVQAHQASYQPFTVLFADSREAWAAYNVQREIKDHRLGRGLHVFSNTAEYDAQSEKLDRAHRQFSQLTDEFRLHPCDGTFWMRSLAKVLGDHRLSNGSTDSRDAICVHGDISGTVSSSIIFYAQSEKRFHSYYSPGPPCRTPFGEALTLDVR